MGDEKAEAAAAASAGRRRRRWLTQESVGAAALILSLSIAGVNAWQALRGPDIALLPPDSLVLYRDAGPRSAALSMAVRLPLVNRASADYGDVVTDVSAILSDGRSGPVFAHQNIVELVFTNRDPQVLLQNCEVRARCVTATGLLAIERGRQLVDLPGGAARDQMFGFTLDAAYCRDSARCGRFSDFDAAVTELTSRMSAATVRVQFSGDRTRGVTCRTRLTADRAAYLRRNGWVSLPCSPPSA